jgi:hypothetical protein
MGNLNAIHFLLTYSCTNTCDRCFLQCSPERAVPSPASNFAERLRKSGGLAR